MVSSEKVLLLKFFGTSFGIKCISYYLIPGLAMGSTYEDTTNFTYLKVAIVLYFILNFANQFLHTQKYKQKIKLLGMKYIIGTLIGIAVYTFVAFSFGAYLVKDTLGSFVMIFNFVVLVFVNSYLYSENFYESLYNLLRIDLEFFHEGNPDRYIQLYNTISFWFINGLAWVMTTFYPYDWYPTPIPYGTINGSIYGAFFADLVYLVVILIISLRDKSHKGI